MNLKLILFFTILMFIGNASANFNDCELIQINSTHWYFETTQTDLAYGEYNYQAFANNISSDYRILEYSSTPPGYTVSGTVYDINNVGYYGVSVTLGSSSTTTASNGTYSFSTVSDGDYTLTVFIDSDGTLSKSITVSGADLAQQDFYYSIPSSGGGGGSGGIVEIVEIVADDGLIITEGIRLGKEDAWYTIDLISLKDLIAGEESKNTWSIIGIVSLLSLIIGFFDKSRTVRGEFLVVIGFVGLFLYAVYQSKLAIVIGLG